MVINVATYLSVNITCHVIVVILIILTLPTLVSTCTTGFVEFRFGILGFRVVTHETSRHTESTPIMIELPGR